jgi:hypothetical protein
MLAVLFGKILIIYEYEKRKFVILTITFINNHFELFYDQYFRFVLKL